jgi:flavin-dependent dehydrogenase
VALAPAGRPDAAGRDAAGLINPMTGEGIYYAVATGVLAGRAAASALRAGDAGAPVHAIGSLSAALLARHLRHTAVASRLVGHTRRGVAGIRAAARDQAVFDDLVEVGLGQGLLTARALRGLAGAAGRP